MCGIYGLIDTGNILTASQRYEVMSILADDNMLRGIDSTGLACIQDGTFPAIYKRPLSAWEFYDQKKSIIPAQHLSRPVLIGHNRMATHGKVNTLNAHPFQCGHVVGTHNGILHGYEHWYDVIGVKARTQCDSEIIFWMANHAKKDKDKALLLSELSGSLTTAFVDSRNQGILYFTVRDNPLYFMLSRGVFLYSSITDSFKACSYILPVEKVNKLRNSLLIPYDYRHGVFLPFFSILERYTGYDSLFHGFGSYDRKDFYRG